MSLRSAQLSPPALVRQADTRRRVSDRPTPFLPRHAPLPLQTEPASGGTGEREATRCRSSDGTDQTQVSTEPVSTSEHVWCDRMAFSLAANTVKYNSLVGASDWRRGGVSPDLNLRCRVEISDVAEA